MYGDGFAKRIELHIVACTCLLLFGLIGSILNCLAFIKAIKVRVLIKSRSNYFLKQENYCQFSGPKTKPLFVIIFQASKTTQNFVLTNLILSELVISVVGVPIELFGAITHRNAIDDVLCKSIAFTHTLLGKNGENPFMR